MRARGSALVAALLAGLAAPADAGPGMRFFFDHPSAAPNERVTIRAGSALSSAFRLYLLRLELAGEVGSRFDRRLSFVGSIEGRALTFSVPPLDPGQYALAYWSPGRRLVVQQPSGGEALLHVQTAAACPVTLPNRSRPPGQPRTVTWYGNGLLWAGLSRDGIYAVSPDRVAADGSIGNKLLWVTTPPFRKPTVSGERLDAPAPPLRVLSVNRGSFAGAERPSYMSAVTFPTAGCWRLRARVGDLSLVYVVSVIVR